MGQNHHNETHTPTSGSHGCPPANNGHVPTPPPDHSPTPPPSHDSTDTAHQSPLITVGVGVCPNGISVGSSSNSDSCDSAHQGALITGDVGVDLHGIGTDGLGTNLTGIGDCLGLDHLVGSDLDLDHLASSLCHI